MKDARIIFIAGPTASGKSALAMQVAEKRGGEIVNADAMQIYDSLRIVTARPSKDDEARFPHHLYGVLDPAERCSAGRWAQLAADCISDIKLRGKIAVLVGGTGLYFKALAEGLSPIPDISLDIREAARARHEELGGAAFREEVIARDPAMARLPEGDAQRLMRAWEVYEATGEPLSSFQDQPRTPLIDERADRAVIMPDREALYATCDTRALAMFSNGAIEEVEALLARGLDPSLPAMKALGVPEIARFLNGESDRDEALELLQRNTRRFAKRQMTWLRNQTPDWPQYASGDAAVAALTPPA